MVFEEIHLVHYVVFAVLINVLVSAFIASQFFSRLRHQQSALIEKLEVNMNVLTSGAHGMGQKLLLLEKKLQSLQSSQEELKTGNMDFSYSTAQKLIAEGVDDRSVAANSGLSATEVNLMRLLHSQTQPSYHSHV